LKNEKNPIPNLPFPGERNHQLTKAFLDPYPSPQVEKGIAKIGAKSEEKLYTTVT
jgi:hypothetical protein